MSIAESFIPEFEFETAAARRVLERVNEEKFGYRPHEKSWTLRQLAGHHAELLQWTDSTLNDDGYDLTPKDKPAYQAPEYKTRDEILKVFDERAAGVKDLLLSKSDEQMMETWTLRSGEEIHFQMPRAAVFRSFIMNHLIHHRGQLTVYLRLTGSPVPQVYGPTADEPG